MKRSIGALLALALLSQPALSQTLFSAKGPIPINLSAAPELFKQCSRPAPDPKGKLWLPTRTEEKLLQKRLILYLTTSGLVQRLRSNAEYRGQYVGFVENGQRKIYAAFSAYSTFLPEPISGKANVWCDGFNSYWGIVYVPKTGNFESFEVNGHI